jgi:hypothetical protein
LTDDGLAGDARRLAGILARDTAFDAAARDAAFADLERAGPDPTGLVLAAMRVCARAGNGHTRAIPNDIVRVAPLRLVGFADGPHVVEAAAGHADLVGRGVTAVNGRPVREVLRLIEPFLAGVPMRRTVLAAMLLAWPEGMARLTGLAPGAPLRLGLSGREVMFSGAELEPGGLRYPVREPGCAGALIARNGRGREAACYALALDDAWYVRLGDFGGFAGSDRPAPELARILAAMAAERRAAAIVDLRGNPGGNFLPAVEFCRRYAGLLAPPARSALLVDRFTFSAAIVAAALMRHHARPTPAIVGEAMGDAERFHAEGGTERLPASGLLVRYSTGWHDWLEGRDARGLTPPAIARHMVAAGPLAPDLRVPLPAADFFAGRDPALDAARKAVRTRSAFHA